VVAHERRLTLGLVATLGCSAWSGQDGMRPRADEEPYRDEPPPAPTALAPPPVAAPEPEPWPENQELVDLDLEHGLPAVVALPEKVRGARPVIVATHGAGGTPEAHCELWRWVVGARAFIVCPRGRPIHGNPDNGYYYANHNALAREVELVLGALAKRYGETVDVAAPIYTGYSQGASMGALMLPHHPAGFGGAVLIEGGVGEYREWNNQVAERFAARGARRVVLACGRHDCAEAARSTIRAMRRGGIEARLVHVAGAGHTYGGELARQVHALFPWLVEGDRRW
jgi:predicted esterase